MVTVISWVRQTLYKNRNSALRYIKEAFSETDKN